MEDKAVSIGVAGVQQQRHIERRACAVYQQFRATAKVQSPIDLLAGRSVSQSHHAGASLPAISHQSLKELIIYNLLLMMKSTTMFRQCGLILLLLCVLSVRCDAEAGPVPAPQPLPEPSPVLSSRTVHTKYGDLRGVIWELVGRHLGSVEVFRGVPYASPPVGNLRFMPPVTGALWRGVKMADRFSPVCPQRLPNISDEQTALKKMPKGRLEYLKRLLPYLQNQSEDCLYLNIYTPAKVKSKYFGGLPLLYV
ncbi:hypothetical protein B566_EDAN001795 [Ephemera danica]|nr:hypothetical protein B566_EDAN001795 [Ephemera danica]